ncbi:hypothetical protein CLCR_01692 [Cladophialophora carrionii]|uniref:Uncharacterized protein n=1 Tax=Cladophialophora carrionii TaxID=86049 RepID=A0A1C1CAT7_9EURO|nr:hypothetical protein CLCR_01692 [Cladophialophora carrionii]
MEYMFVVAPGPSASASASASAARSLSSSQCKKDLQKVDSMIKSHAARMSFRCRVKDAGREAGAARMLTPEKYPAGGRVRDGVVNAEGHARQKHNTRTRTQDDRLRWRVYHARRTNAERSERVKENSEGENHHHHHYSPPQQQHQHQQHHHSPPPPQQQHQQHQQQQQHQHHHHHHHHQQQQQCDDTPQTTLSDFIPPALSVISHQVPKHLESSVQFRKQNPMCYPFPSPFRFQAARQTHNVVSCSASKRGFFFLPKPTGPFLYAR